MRVLTHWLFNLKSDGTGLKGKGIKVRRKFSPTEVPVLYLSRFAGTGTGIPMSLNPITLNTEVPGARMWFHG
jgi:hypothetical protein